MRLIPILMLTLALVSCRNHNNKLTVLFNNVEGLEEGASVYYKGFIVGKVTGFNLNQFKDQVVVDIKLNDKIRIPVESRAIINSSVMGSTHITIEPSVQSTFLSSHDTIRGEYGKKRLLDGFVSDTARERKIHESFEKISEGINGLIEASAKDSSKNSR